MEHIQKLLDKSDHLLDAEMTRSQSLVEDIKNLHAKYQELESLHKTLSTTYEKLSVGVKTGGSRVGGPELCV